MLCAYGLFCWYACNLYILYILRWESWHPESYVCYPDMSRLQALTRPFSRDIGAQYPVNEAVEGGVFDLGLWVEFPWISHDVTCAVNARCLEYVFHCVSLKGVFLAYFQESYNTPLEHTPHNPPGPNYERIPDLQPVGKGFFGVCSSSVCWNNLRVVFFSGRKYNLET